MPALILVVILAAIIGLKLLPAMSGQTQVFTDFIIENVSASGLNKSGELTLFWVIVTGGAVLLCVICHVYHLIKVHSGKSRHENPLFQSYEEFAEEKHLLCLLAMLLPFSAGLIIFGQLSLPLLCGMILYFLCQFSKRDCLYEVLFTYILSYYQILSVCSIGCHFSTKFRLSSAKLYILTLITGTVLNALILLLERNKKEALYRQRLLFVLQCFFPGLFSVFMIDKYLYQGSIIRVPYAPGYYIFFAALVLASLFALLYQLIRYWKEKKDDFICFVTPMIVFVYHSFCAAPMYAQPDQHHHGEQMIPWNQIFEHGQKLYETYTPVSGLFPFVNGSIQHLLLDGTITDYAPAISITMVIFCLLTMYFIYKHTDGIHAMLFALLFTLPCYNRQYMVLPLLLLLTLPKLIEQPAKWFFSYILGSFLAGLYYPLFGAAVLLGLAPLAVWQLLHLKSASHGKHSNRGNADNADDATHTDKSQMNNSQTNSLEDKETFNTNQINASTHTAQMNKKLRVLTAFTFLFIIIALSLPLLFRILNHTLTYSSQTVTADGIALSNQTAPDYFMPYLTYSNNLRQYCYLALRFLLPAIGIWLFVYFLFHALMEQKIEKALYYLAGGITLAVSYSYTLVRADTGKILSRTAPILIAVAGIYLPLHLMKEAKKSRLIIAFCLSLPMMIYMQVSQTKNPDLWVYPDGDSQLVMDDSAKLFSYYTVPDTFLKSEDTGLAPRYQKLLGRGFMVSDQLHYIKDYAKVIEKCEKISDNLSYMAFDGQGFFDYLGVKCYGTGYIPAARSYDAQMEIWKSDPDNLPVVFYIQPMYSYYIFREMMTCGYIYDSADKAFYPPTLYAELTAAGLCTPAENDYRIAAEATDFELSAVSFARSYETLSEILDTSSARSLSNADLPDSFSGSEYDVLYLEFTEPQTPDSVLSIRFEDAEGNTFSGANITCNLNGSSVLIPTGMNACWYLSEIDDFTITVQAPAAHSDTTVTYQELKNEPSDKMPIKDIRLICCLYKPASTSNTPLKSSVP